MNRVPQPKFGTDQGDYFVYLLDYCFQITFDNYLNMLRHIRDLRNINVVLYYSSRVDTVMLLSFGY